MGCLLIADRCEHWFFATNNLLPISIRNQVRYRLSAQQTILKGSNVGHTNSERRVDGDVISCSCELEPPMEACHRRGEIRLKERAIRHHLSNVRRDSSDRTHVQQFLRFFVFRECSAFASLAEPAHIWRVKCPEVWQGRDASYKGQERRGGGKHDQGGGVSRGECLNQRSLKPPRIIAWCACKRYTDGYDLI